MIKHLHEIIVESVPVGILVSDAFGEIVFSNSMAARLHGGAVTGNASGPQGGYRLFHPDGAPYLPEELPLAISLRTGDRIADVEIVIRPDVGKEVVVLASSTPLWSRKGEIEGAVTVFQDITDRKWMEMELQAGEERFRTSVETLQDGFGILSAVRSEAGSIVDFCVEYLNEAGARISGSPVEAFVGGSLLGLFSGQFSSELFQDYVRVVEEGVPLLREHLSYEESPGGQRLRRYYDIRGGKLGDGLTVVWRDVTTRKLAEEALRESEERFRKIFEEGPVGVAIVGLDRRLQRVNQFLCRMLGYRSEELVGAAFDSITDPEDVDIDKIFEERLLKGEIQTYRVEKRYRCRDGSLIWGELIVSLVRSEGAPLYGIAMIADMTDRKRLEEQLVHAATYDHLTGLLNRQALEAAVAGEIERARRYRRPFSLVMLDIDRFKDVNDTFGHLFGDEVLKSVASLIRRHIRNVDACGRWGGEEFVILLPENGVAEGAVLAEKLRTLVAEQKFAEAVTVTASFGATEFRGDESMEEMMRRADATMYLAKENGRNRVETG